VAPVDGAPAERLHPAVARLVDRLDPQPAYVTGRAWDVVAANRAARLLWTDWDQRAPADRNMLWWTLTDPVARRVLADWQEEAEALVGRLRAAFARRPHDPAVTGIITRLLGTGDPFATWWASQDVAPIGTGRKRMRHPILGDIELDVLVLLVADDPDQKVVTFPSDAATSAAIAALVEHDVHRPR
jgi:hypothetical protein